ncbi:unnamed protein product, partial [Wuchereria bancrofti]
MRSLWLFIILSAFPKTIHSAASKKSVITSLHAKWSQTSFIAEARKIKKLLISEINAFKVKRVDRRADISFCYVDFKKFKECLLYLQVSFFSILQFAANLWLKKVTLYFGRTWMKLLRNLMSTSGTHLDKNWTIVMLYNKDSDARQYDLAVRLAGYLLEEARVNLLKFALSLRAHSPTVLLFQRLGTERKKSCAAFADVHGTLTCDVNDLKKVIESDNRGPVPTVYSIDHIFPATKEHNVTLIVYGELATPSWRKFHLVAKALSRSGKVKYILRHFVKDVLGDKPLLSGYGVELAIKSTEYKAVDDSNAVTDKVAVEESSEEYVDNEEDNYGFNFSTLRTENVTCSIFLINMIVGFD